MISKQDRLTLRSLARRLAGIAADPAMARRRELWREHNDLKLTRPLILIFPEGGWRELLPDRVLKCETEQGRILERMLREKIYAHEHFAHDFVVEAQWIVAKTVSDTGWGLTARWRDSSNHVAGARGFDPVLREPSDLRKLRLPEAIHDEAASARALEQAQDLLGDILPVSLKGIQHISFHLMSLYTSLRGLDQTLLDMMLAPGLVHEAMALFEEGHRRLIEQYERLGVLDLNNDGTYHSSGGNGYTSQLPAPGFDPSRIRPRDLWASAESQEMSSVSPEMHETFALQYERRLLEPFGLTGYGCCEDLTHKLDRVLTIPHLRRISISPWANVEACAERLRGDYVFSWKPCPWHLAGAFDESAIEACLRRGIRAAARNGCILEIILKDTHTCENHPERFDRWSAIARRVVDEESA